MDISRTREQLILEAADKLQLVGTGQPLEAEYREKIDNNIEPLLSQLDRDGICSVGDSNEIPVEWFDPIAGLLANVCAPLAGRNYDAMGRDYYERTLRRITSAKASYEILEGTYF
jgi:hypothetical protein